MSSVSIPSAVSSAAGLPAVVESESSAVLRLPVVDRGELLVGQVGPQSGRRMSKADEHPQQIRRLGQVLRRCHDLAGNPVVEQDLGLHRAPSQRVIRAVVGAVPQQRPEQFTVIEIIEPGSVCRAKEPIREPSATRWIPLRPLVSGSTFGQARRGPRSPA